MKKPNEMTFLEHLGELRKRILVSILFLVVFFFVGWAISGRLYGWLSLPLLQFMPAGQKLAFTSLTDPFMMYLKVAFIFALFAASPFIFHQLWLFIAPALYPGERRWVVPFVIATTLFFLAGGAFGYFVVFPVACRFFLQVGRDFTPIITIGDYFSLAFRVLFGIAVVFELPVLIFLLAKLRLVSARFLWKYFRYAVVAIFILAAVVTPTPDMVTQVIFAVPMILLYLLGLFIAWLVNPGEKAEEE